jgi:hypothetical protein
MFLISICGKQTEKDTVMWILAIVKEHTLYIYIQGNG